MLRCSKAKKGEIPMSIHSIAKGATMTHGKKSSRARRHLLSCTALGAAMSLMAVSTAQAAVANAVAAKVQPVTSQVSYSTAASVDPAASPPLNGQTFVAYDVTVTNVSGNAVNTIEFIGALSVQNLATATPATNTAESQALALGPVYNASGQPVGNCSKLASPPANLLPAPPPGALVITCSIGKLTAGSSSALKIFSWRPRMQQA